MNTPTHKQYRDLANGEIVQKGDEVQYWSPVTMAVGLVVDEKFKFRRPVELSDQSTWSQEDWVREYADLEKKIQTQPPGWVRAAWENRVEKLEAELEKLNDVIRAYGKLEQSLKGLSSSVDNALETLQQESTLPTHRMLKAGEVIKDTDEFITDGSWRAVYLAAVGDGLYESNVGRFRRPL